MKCEYCNKEIPSNSVFCPECGRRQKISVSKKYICPTCGAPLEYNDLFCQECGTPCDPILIDTSSKRFRHHSTQDTNCNTLADAGFFKMVIIAVFVILALAILLHFFYKKNGEDILSQNSISTEHSNAIPSQPDKTENTSEMNMDVPSDGISDNEGINETVKAKTTEDSASSDYILPQSTSRLLNSNDISGLSLREINYAKNEIYARHGRRFNSPELQNYFNGKSWYQGTINPDSFGESLLSDTEKKNAEFLATTEFSLDPNGYQLDAN